jgi:hypothetical protein
LKLKYDEPHPNCAFNFNLRRYTKSKKAALADPLEVRAKMAAAIIAGAYTRPLFSST